MASSLFQNTLFATIAGSVTTISTFASGLIFARILSVEETGTAVLLLWIVNSFYTICAFGIPFTLSRVLLSEGCPSLLPVQRGLVLYSASAFLVAIISVSSMVLFFGLILFQFGFLPGHGKFLESPVTCVMLGMCFLTQCFSEFEKGFLRGQRKFDQLATRSSLSSIALILSVAVGTISIGVDGVLVGYIVYNVTFGCSWTNNIKSCALIAVQDKRRLLRYSFFRWLGEILSIFVWARIEILFLQLFFGSVETGLLSVGLMFANMATMLPLMMTSSLLPHFHDEVGKANIKVIEDQFRVATRLMSLIVFPACLGLVAITPELLPLIFGPKFSGSIIAAMILTAGAAVPAVGSVGRNLLLVGDNSDAEFYTTAIGFVLSLIVGFTIIPFFGLIGAALARVIVQSVAILVMYMFLRRRVGVRTYPADFLAPLVISIVIYGLAVLILSVFGGFLGIIFAITFSCLAFLSIIAVPGLLHPADARVILTLFRRIPTRIRFLLSAYENLLARSASR